MASVQSCCWPRLRTPARPCAGHPAHTVAVGWWSVCGPGERGHARVRTRCYGWMTVFSRYTTFVLLAPIISNRRQPRLSPQRNWTRAFRATGLSAAGRCPTVNAPAGDVSRSDEVQGEKFQTRPSRVRMNASSTSMRPWADPHARARRTRRRWTSWCSCPSRSAGGSVCRSWRGLAIRTTVWVCVGESTFYDGRRASPQIAKYYEQQFVVEAWRQALFETVRSTKSHSVLDKLLAINRPTLVICGEEDRIVDSGAVYDAVQYLPSFEFRLIPAAATHRNSSARLWSIGSYGVLNRAVPR